MRVVAGKYRGKKLKEFDISSTRPTLDRVKESLFSLIQFDIMDSVVLDLFSGTGALGLEAISRGAKKTYLVDSNKQAINLIKENLSKVIEPYEIIYGDALAFLKNTKEKFDIVLLDPPFNSDLGLQAIDYILKNNLLTDSGIIIFETSAENDFDFSKYDITTTRKKYGSVAVYKLTKERI